ncbi:Site-specific DNA recombinase [Nitrosospira multiformis]|uniref:Site-specific DNA recombinase n=1 Tax=Nitrosospira multiformis TaxID=1231 RepID=A0A1H8PX00_9PROT|nr:recombinase family protein [Nitrosospira multiformis]SEO46291.1 Site-specific DNA recombinase [Nitrosospira multiformis]
MKIGYARVSTDDQNLDLQLDALTRAECEQVFTDHGVSGAIIEREGLSQAIAAVGRGDVLVVWKLDRLGRSLSFLIELIEKLRNEGAGFESLSDGINTTSAGGKLVFHIMGALAEFERSLISERSKAGMQAARRRGKHLGRPHKLSREQINHAAQMIREGRETVSGMAGLLSVDRTTLYRALSKVR